MSDDPLAKLSSVPPFQVISEDLIPGKGVPLAQMSGMLGAGSGLDRSPQLSWTGFPRHTRSFSVTIFDADAPTPSGFWHWAVADIPAQVTSIAAGAGDSSGRDLPTPAIHLRNDLSMNEFVGFAPDIGSGDHRIYVVVHALDVKKIGVDRSSTPALLQMRMNNHTVARAVLLTTVAIGLTNSQGAGYFSGWDSAHT
jgi:Raf kinase inhibitor-like YbhB/YbcL family protein